MKRILDVLISVNIILVSLPFVIIFIFFIYINDFKNPIYFAKRVGLKFKPITVYKLRSMTTSQNTNFQSTSDEDPRITKVGKIIRRYKIDEFVQFYNVLFGNISIVGPRPNVQDDVKKYTSLERKILSVKPGITDFSSIVFSDEGSILKNSENPDLDYNKFIRPWKSRLAILYIENMSITIDIKLIFLTFYNLINRKKTLIYLNSILKEITSDQELLNISLRESELYEKEPPK
tara:strand:- start:408 stop:1106 length:699 start_codon:yes stop_codon:yes gene_type:complete